jgi:hypothetical protein
MTPPPQCEGQPFGVREARSSENHPTLTRFLAQFRFPLRDAVGGQGLGGLDLSPRGRA